MQKYRYFRAATVLNRIAWAAALCLVGGLLYLLMFEAGNGRAFYVACWS